MAGAETLVALTIVVLVCALASVIRRCSVLEKNATLDWHENRKRKPLEAEGYFRIKLFRISPITGEQYEVVLLLTRDEVNDAARRALKQKEDAEPAK